MLKLALAVLPASLLLFLPPGDSAGIDEPSLASPPIGTAMVPLADGGCRHTIKVRNAGSRTVTIRWSNSSVRNKVGFWKQLYGGGFGVFYKAPDPAEFPVASGQSYSWIYTTDFGCSANRRWRFDLRRSDGNSSMLYYPSSSSFSQNTTVDLGDLGRSSLW
ncbi:MAG: hypothetical protein Q8W45_12065 [Candidatus Palauibacterales bacterium]|nr:hypothetical protein [Candidatus Palauibacterales bacterium]